MGEKMLQQTGQPTGVGYLLYKFMGTTDNQKKALPDAKFAELKLWGNEVTGGCRKGK
jgi:hypothetical protein